MDGEVIPTNIHIPKKLIVVIFLLLILSISISGCVTMNDPEASQDYTADPLRVLDAQSSLGQSFVSRRPNLNGITIWVTRTTAKTAATPSSDPNILTVKLFFAPENSKPVLSKTVAIPASGTNLPISITIPNQQNPGGQSYYLLFSNDSGTMQINGRNEDAYPLGQAYVNNKPINADIAFRLSYDYGLASLIADLRNSSISFWLIVPLLFVIWLPGWLLLDFSGLRARFDLGEQTALATGLSLAIIPVLMLWSTILKLKWTSRGLYFAAGFLLAILIVRVIYSVITARRSHLKDTASQIDQPQSLSKRRWRFITWQSLVIMLVFILSLAVRLIMIRDLATPAWVDSVHHTLITRLIMDTGYYPSTYLPYWDFPPTSYHPGFHSIAAAFTWLSQLDLIHSLLIVGQVLNAMAVFAVYLFAKTLTRSPSAGLFAAIIAGFLTPMPAYYTSWGRYTELTGLLLLPVILTLFQAWLETNSKRESAWIVILGAIATGGLFIIHYRVLAFMACLLISFVVFHLLLSEGGTKTKPTRMLIFIAFVAVSAIILVIPWLIPTIKTTLLPHLTPSSASNIALFQDFSWSYLTSAFGTQTLAIAGLGWLWGVLHGKRLPYMLILWVFFLFLMANLAALKLPGGGLINNSSVEIMLFIPISILGGYFIDQLLTQWKVLIPRQLVLPSVLIIFLLFGYVSFLGAKRLIPILNPITILSRSADLPAIQWVSENIPQGETVVINPFAWGYNLYAGNDGGYWISPLSGRPTLPPPVLYGMGSNSVQISQISQQIIDLSPNPVSFWEFLNTHQLRYVYIGARGGIISPDRLASSGLFNLIYHLNGVWIFSTKP